MSIRVYQVTHTFMQRLFCDGCEQKDKFVEMRPGGMAFKKYQHICPACGARKLMDRPFPITEHRLVELEQVDEQEEESKEYDSQDKAAGDVVLQ